MRQGCDRTTLVGSTRNGVDIEKQDAGFAITSIALKLAASVPGIDQARFSEIAADAKANCPVSKALSATPITLEAKLL